MELLKRGIFHGNNYMVASTFHQGSGLGNQLFRYIMTRTLALDKGYEWTMINPENFKGKSFLQLPVLSGINPNMKQWREKEIRVNGIDIRGYDPEINFVEDNTIIDGEFQDERYWGHRLPEIKEWLKTEPLEMDDNTCIINFRGGEYKIFPDLFLTKEYWDKAIMEMLKINPKMKFEVHTDDIVEAQKFFPKFTCYQDIELNWRSIRYAKYLILSNSSFAILPALLGDAKEIISPRYWARRNTRVWALPQNYYKRFTYI